MNGSDRPAFAEERRRLIAETVAVQGGVRSTDLVDSFGVSEQTIRKDLGALQARGLLKRTHGGAIAVESRPEQPPQERVSQHREAKLAIAQKIASLISPGLSVFLDNGTTLEMVADAITTPDINVLTSAIGVARIMAERPGIRHTLLGGQLRVLSGSLVGPVAIDNARKFTLDVAVIGAGGLTADGITVADIAESQVKQAIIQRARQVIVALDSSKFGYTDYVGVCGLDQIDVLVTDTETSEVEEWCADAGTTILLADQSES